MKKPHFKDYPFWDEAIGLNEEYKGRILELKSFLQAPDSGLLVIDILKKLLDLPNHLNQEISKPKKFKRLISTATLVYESIPATTKRIESLSLQGYRNALIRINNLNDSKDVQEIDNFISNKAFHSIKTKSPIYIILFYPQIATPLEDIRLNYAVSFAKYLTAYAILLSIKHEKNDLKRHNKSKNCEDAIYPLSLGLTRAFTLEHYQSIDIENFRELKKPISIVNAIRKLRNKLICFEVSVGSSNNDELCSALMRIQSFFNIFVPHNKIQENDPTTSNNTSKSHNLRMGIVLSSNLKHDYSFLEIDEKNIRLSKSSQLTQHDSSSNLPGESIGETLLISPFKPCELNNPIVNLHLAKNINTHIALHNQHLKPRLTQHQIEFLREILGNHFKNFKHPKLEKHVAELKLLGLLCLGRDINKIYYQQIPLDLKPDSIFCAEDFSHIIITIPNYEAKTIIHNPNLYEPSSLEFFKIPIENKQRTSLKRLLLPLIKQNKTSVEKKDKGVIKLQQTVFFKETLNKGLIDAVAIRNHVFGSYLSLSNSDLWLTSIFTGRSSGIQNTLKHYASAKPMFLVRIFKKHLIKTLGIQLPIKPVPNASKQRVGSGYFLKEKVFSHFIKKLHTLAKTPIAPYAKFSNENLETICRNLFLYMLYTDLYISFCAATRNIQDPFIDYKLINQDGFTPINDKNKFDGFNTRIVPIDKDLRYHLEKFPKIRNLYITELKRRKVITKDSDETLAKNNLFLPIINPLTGQLVIKPYIRSQAWFEFSESGAFTHLFDAKYRVYKDNSNRHYLRGKLLDLETHPDFINAFMGHWHIGQEPWSDRGLFNFEKYQTEISSKISAILKELGFKPIK